MWWWLGTGAESTFHVWSSCFEFLPKEGNPEHQLRTRCAGSWWFSPRGCKQPGFGGSVSWTDQHRGTHVARERPPGSDYSESRCLTAPGARTLGWRFQIMMQKGGWQPVLTNASFFLWCGWLLCIIAPFTDEQTEVQRVHPVPRLETDLLGEPRPAPHLVLPVWCSDSRSGFTEALRLQEWRSSSFLYDSPSLSCSKKSHIPPFPGSQALVWAVYPLEGDEWLDRWKEAQVLGRLSL